MPGATPPISTLQQAILRARSCVGTGRHLTGAGGLAPTASTPESALGPRRGCDGAGFLAWCLAYSRHQLGFAPGWDWVNADSMIVEAEVRGLWFQTLGEPEVGAVLAYPSIELERDGRRERDGHAGLIVEMPATWRVADASWMAIRVVHCARSLQRRLGYAIGETHAVAWSQRATFRGVSNPSWRTRFLRYVRRSVP